MLPSAPPGCSAALRFAQLKPPQFMSLLGVAAASTFAADRSTVSPCAVREATCPYSRSNFGTLSITVIPAPAIDQLRATESPADGSFQRAIQSFDRSRSATRRAISAGASSGIGNTELALISPST